MTRVLFLALGSALCSAISTVLKHHSADAMPSSEGLGRRAGAMAFVTAMLTSPLWLFGLLADAGGITLQILALRRGDLSFVQPILTTSLVIALVLNHVSRRTRLSVRETLYSLGLIGGLVGFLWVSGATSPHDSAARGALVPAIVTGAVTAALVVGSVWYVRRGHHDAHGARALAVTIAAIYAATAGLIKTCNRIFAQHGALGVATSWQLWLLLVVGATGLLLTQYAFSLAPLAASLPVIASLDPLFSVAIGMFVYAERLRDNAFAILAELVFLTVLLVSVGLLSRRAAVEESGDPALN